MEHGRGSPFLEVGFSAWWSVSLDGSGGVSMLEQLPEEVLAKIIGDYLCRPTDTKAAAESCRELCLASRSPLVAKRIRDLGMSGLGIVVAPEVSSGDLLGALTQLAPFVRADNPCALYAVAWLALYVEQDMEKGLSLLEHGAQKLGDRRALYELGVLLSVRGSRKNDAEMEASGRAMLAEGKKRGCPLSELVTVGKTAPKEKKARGLEEQRAFECLGLRSLMSSRTGTRVDLESCANKCCGRNCPTDKKHILRKIRDGGFSDAWRRAWSNELNGCYRGDRSSYFDAESFYRVPRFALCARCERTVYCGFACQKLDWARHKKEECQEVVPVD